MLTLRTSVFVLAVPCQKRLPNGAIAWMTADCRRACPEHRGLEVDEARSARDQQPHFEASKDVPEENISHFSPSCTTSNDNSAIKSPTDDARVVPPSADSTRHGRPVVREAKRAAVKFVHTAGSPGREPHTYL